MITVFTPVYNRAHTLPRLFSSLCEQTCKDFEWLIVNDGSSDNSEEIIKQLISSKPDFVIRYFSKENGGKHRAINFAVPKANGDMFFIVDSDDWLPKNAIEIIVYRARSIGDRTGFAGVGGAKYYADGRLCGNTFSYDYVDATSLQRKQFNIIGEKAEVFYTDVLKKYPFPEFENETFLSEATVWNKIAADSLKIRWFNENIYFMEYQPDGLTANLTKLYRKNPKGYIYYVKQEADLHKVSTITRLIWYSRVIHNLKGIISSSQLRFFLDISSITLYICKAIFPIYHILRK